MKLYSLLKNIKDISAAEMVNQVFIGDVYEVNTQQDIEYPISVITEGTHTGNTENDTEVYGITIFLIDRLLDDKSNENEVKSWANEGLKDMIDRIEEVGIGIVYDNYQIVTFTNRFEALCAGAYATLQIEVPNDGCCGDTLPWVTTVNGMKGDVILSFPDTSNFYTKGEIDTKETEIKGEISILDTNKADKTEFENYYTKNEINSKEDTLNTEINKKVNITDYNLFVENQTFIDMGQDDRLTALESALEGVEQLTINIINT